ncbi:hypothetical protein BJX66DRAFT_104778 [Aspergillus keveii]|jgi:hypothetical protein|uniref:Uncharacterized protein n=1 Tax=Aspergillus keveii TaxID=714993 RepID=A0ABR4GPN5_9EURO
MEYGWCGDFSGTKQSPIEVLFQATGFALRIRTSFILCGFTALVTHSGLIILCEIVMGDRIMNRMEKAARLQAFILS